MKKIFVFSICTALAVTFSACGSTSSESKVENEEVVVMEEPVDVGEEAEEEKSELISTNYQGISFSYPDYCTYTENETYATLNIVPNEKGITIMAQDESELGELADTMFVLANSSILSGFDDVEDREDYDTTLAGLDAKGTTAIVTSSDITANYTITTIFDENTKYIYSICYMTTPESDEDDSVYSEFMDSISIDSAEPEMEEEEVNADDPVPSEFIAALNSAESYSNTLNLSKQGIYDQLTSEYGGQFDEDAAQYAVDNMVVDWNANALASAQSYNDSLHLSKQGLYDQLTSEYGGKFTEEEAQYAVDNVEADWNANALEAAKNYRDNLNMSSSAIHDQLTSEYGGQFTEEEADYAIANLD